MISNPAIIIAGLLTNAGCVLCGICRAGQWRQEDAVDRLVNSPAVCTAGLMLGAEFPQLLIRQAVFGRIDAALFQPLRQTLLLDQLLNAGRCRLHFFSKRWA